VNLLANYPTPASYARENRQPITSVGIRKGLVKEVEDLNLTPQEAASLIVMLFTALRFAEPLRN
jgi:hypothetical protein